MEPTRRDLLRTGGAVAASGVAGCLGGGGSGGGMQLDALSVAGSPGGRVRVHPPGTVALLDYFATWCAPCKPQMAELRAVRERFGDRIAMRSITTERDRDAVRSFWREYEGTWPVLIDPKLRAAERYEFRRVPTLAVVDADGEEVWRHVGLAAADDVADAVRTAKGDGG